MIKDFRRIYCDFCDKTYLELDYAELLDVDFSLEEDTEDFLLNSNWQIIDDMHICEDCIYKKSLE